MKKTLPLTPLFTYKMTGYMEREKFFDVLDENLFASTNKMSRKVMVPAAISWYGITKPFFCELKWY